MSDITAVGLDLAKTVFQFRAADGAGPPVLRKTLRRNQVLDFLGRMTVRECDVSLRRRPFPDPRASMSWPPLAARRREMTFSTCHRLEEPASFEICITE